VQQNPSGSITRYEEILERQENGTFRRTQRFEDGNGDVMTEITPDFRVRDPFILAGGGVLDEQAGNPFPSYRGTQLDLRA
jgi:hypothetical protein